MPIARSARRMVRDPALARRFAGFALAGAACVAVLVGAASFAEWVLDVRRDEERARQISHLVNGQATRAMNATVVALRQVADDIAAGGAADRLDVGGLNARIALELSLLDELQAVAVVDMGGTVVAGSLPDHLVAQQLKEEDAVLAVTRGVQVLRAVSAGSTGGALLPLRIDDEAGGTLSAVALVDLTPLMAFGRPGWSDFPLQAALMLTDGSMLAATPSTHDDQAGELMLGRPGVLATVGVNPTLDSATWARAGGSGRVALTRGSEWPVITVAFVANRVIVEQWLADLAVLATLGGLLIIAIGISAIIIYRAQSARGRAQDRLLDAIEAIPDGFLLRHPARGRVIANSSFLRMFKVGTSVDRSLVQQSIGLAGTDDDGGERVIDTPSGRTVRASTCATRDGGTVSVFTDITDRLRAEAERQRMLERQFYAQKMEALGTLAGGVAHDFNNLLAALLGFVWAARRRTSDPEVSGLLDKATMAGNRASGVAKQLLTFAHPERAARETIHVGQVIEEVRSLIAASLPPHVELTVKAQPSLQVVGSRDQLSQVLVNLAINAQQAIEGAAGKISITAAPERVSADDDSPVSQSSGGAAADHMDGHEGEVIRVESDPETGRATLHTGSTPPGEYVSITVADDGRGLAPVVLRRIFEPFFTTKQSQGGSGLGMSVVLGVLRAHDGACTIETELGGGTRFKLLLPRSTTVAKRIDKPARAGAAATARILLVDDDPAVLDGVAALLRSGGYELETAPDGPAALEACRRTAAPFDLIIVDLAMPGMSGVSFTEALRGSGCATPVVLHTGGAEADRVWAAHGTLFVGLIKKPADGPVLLQAVEDALAGHPRSEADGPPAEGPSEDARAAGQ